MEYGIVESRFFIRQYRRKQMKIEAAEQLLEAARTLREKGDMEGYRAAVALANREVGKIQKRRDSYQSKKRSMNR